MTPKLFIKKMLVIAIAIASITAPQTIFTMTTAALRTAGAASRNAYKATPTRAITTTTPKQNALAVYEGMPTIPPQATWYEILGVSENATQAEINAAYRKLAQQYHPDKFTNPMDKAKAQEAFKTINNAKDKFDNSPGGNVEDKLREAMENFENAIRKHNPNYPEPRNNPGKTKWDIIKNEIKSIHDMWKDEKLHDAFWNAAKATEKMQGGIKSPEWQKISKRFTNKNNATVQEVQNGMRKKWELTKGVGHAAYTIPTLVYGANRTDKLEFQDDLYNSHMETISDDDNNQLDTLPPLTPKEQEDFNNFVDEQITLAAEEIQQEEPAASTQQQDSTDNDSATNPMTIEPTIQENQPTPTMWNSFMHGAQTTLNYASDLATDATTLMNDNPLATAAIAIAITGTAGYYAYRYFTTPTVKKEPVEEVIENK